MPKMSLPSSHTVRCRHPIIFLTRLLILFLYSIGLLSEAKMNVIEELPIEQLVVRLVLSSRIEMVVLILFISG